MAIHVHLGPPTLKHAILEQLHREEPILEQVSRKQLNRKQLNRKQVSRNQVSRKDFCVYFSIMEIVLKDRTAHLDMNITGVNLKIISSLKQKFNLKSWIIGEVVQGKRVVII